MSVLRWRINVFEPDGTLRSNVDVDDAVFSLDSFSVSPAGSCQEANWRMLPSAVDVRARDIIRLWTSADGGVTLVPRFLGTVVMAGNPRSTEVQSYRAVGMKQRLYERVCEQSRVAGGDVGDMVRNVMNSMTRPLGVVYNTLQIPLLTFTLGDRFPALESYGDLFDALAASVGRFIVPTGESYTYDGVTYTAGETVPAVEWGVLATGRFYFKRPQATALAFDESHVGTRVTWAESSAEEYVNSVTLAYATAVQSERLIAWGPEADPRTQTEELAVVPLTRTFTAEPLPEQASKIVTLPGPLDYMRVYKPDRLLQYGTWTSGSYSTDGNLGTYATMNDGTSVSWSAGDVGAAIWRVRLAWFAGNDIIIRLVLYHGELSTLVYVINGADNESNGQPIDLWLPALPLASVTFTDTATASLTIQTQVAAGSNPVRVHEVEYYLPDIDSNHKGSQYLAESFMRPVPEAVAVVESFEIPSGNPFTQTINLTTLDGWSLKLPVERVEYSITTGEGAVTRYHIGQAFEPDLEAQRVVLEQLARRATKGGMR